MFLINRFFNEKAGLVSFSRQQASDFAKKVAGDFNPIHDPDAKRFCVPGDLLFAVVLARYGLSQHMHFKFLGMVGDGVALRFPEKMRDKKLSILDEKGREYLTVEAQGDTNNEETLIDILTRRYVEFSGQTFLHILVPLMREHQVMINPKRPLVIYESMSIDMMEIDVNDIALELTNSSLEVNGKRGDATLEFSLLASGEVVGKGKKTMVLSSLRPFDEDVIAQLVEQYSASKEAVD
ncbi:MAG TPA: DUF3581 family protein [Gammaproteobacteria bacterium]|nr:DUF3581 family protein [Gammaproteobacteria bacterium]